MRLYNFTGWLLLIIMFWGLDALRFEPKPRMFGAVAADTVTYGDKRIVYKVTIDTVRNQANDLRRVPDLSNAPAGARFRMITDTSAFDSALIVTGDTFAMSPMDSSTAVTVASNWGYGDPYEVTLAWHDTTTGPDPLENFAAVASHDTLRSSWDSISDSVRLFSGLNEGGQEDTVYVAGNATPHDRVVTVEGSYYSCGNAYTTQAAGDYADNRCDGATIDTTGGGGGSGDHPNEPIDFVTVTERRWSAFNEDSWGNAGTGGGYNLITDATAPETPDSIGEAFYAQGRSDGSAPMNTWREFGSTKDELYVHFWIKLSANFQMHDNGTVKTYFVTDNAYGGGGDPVFFRVNGTPGCCASDLKLQVNLQGPGDERSQSGGANMNPNVGSAAIPRDTWVEFEIHMVMNTGSNFDGELHVWTDGTKSHEYTDVRYEDPLAGGFTGLKWNPTFGGNTGDTVDADMEMWMDHIYVSSP